MSRILLTSFEPFDQQPINSSLEVGRVVAGSPPSGVELDWIILPVVARECVELAWERVERLRPALVLALGQATGAAAVCVERQAVNLDDYHGPDNAGNQPRKQPIVPDGPAVYPTTIPTSRVVGELGRHGIPADLSDSAGTYVCNHLLYGLLHRSALTDRGHRTGFLHLPLLPVQIDPRKPQPSLPLERLADAVRLAITICLE